MREILTSDPFAAMPPRMMEQEAMWMLPWQRRERADASIRRAITEFRALAELDTPFQRHYVSMAECFESALRLLDAIEDSS